MQNAERLMEKADALPPVRILIIDDEPSFVRGLARLLQRDGYTVDTADNGQHALDQLHAQRYDVVLCDLHMPELDGPTLYALLRRQSPSLCQRVIFVIGDTLGVASTAFLEQCGQPCLYKPCTAAEVRGAIQQHAVVSSGTEARGEERRRHGEPLAEEGTLSIVRRGKGYQVRYASNNPYALDRLPRACPDEATLRGLLHHLGTEAEVLHHTCAIVRQGGMAVVRILVAPGQIQDCFRHTA
jgi:CheY-like chemotaxis protein